MNEANCAALSDRQGLRIALAQADLIQGQTGENPAVGCAITDKSGHLIGVGHTGQGGRPHAEINALAMAGPAAQGGTAYVTLEPCAHHGKTGPCAKALISAGISHVIIAQDDPDARVSGKGIAMLNEAGITTKILNEPRAMRQMAGFLSRTSRNKPFVRVKIATSKDGFITAKSGTQTWLTGAISRRFVHDMRSRCDVILTSSATITADNPSMNVRIEGYQPAQPVLAILDRNASLSPKAACLVPHRDVIIYHKAGASRKAWPDNVRSVPISEDGQGLSLPEVMADLHQRQLSSIMVEAGARLFDSLHMSGMIDELTWLKAPKELKSGVFAWESPDKIDFCAPHAYIMTNAFSLGADEAIIMRPNQ